MHKLFKKANFNQHFKTIFAGFQTTLLKTIVSKELVLKINEKLQSKEKFSKKYYEELIDLFPKSESGVVELRKSLFHKAVKDAENEKDIGFLVDVAADYMGNEKPLKSSELDLLLKKALDLKCPLTVLPLLKNHRAMMYYPHSGIIADIFTFFNENRDYESMKTFFFGLTRRFFIKKEAIVYDIFIENAIIKKDFDSSIQAFLDILDYNQTILNLRTYNMLISTYDLFLQDSHLFDVFESIIETHNLKNIGIMFCFSIYYAEKNNKEKFTDAVNCILKICNDIESQKEESSLINSSVKIEVFESTYINSFLDKLSRNKEEKSLNSFYYDNFVQIIEKDLIRKKIFHSSYSEVIKNILNRSK